jgi:hypothetical protein
MKFFQAVTSDRKVLIELRQDDGVALAHIIMDPELARTVSGDMLRLADIADGTIGEIK